MRLPTSDPFHETVTEVLWMGGRGLPTRRRLEGTQRDGGRHESSTLDDGIRTKSTRSRPKPRTEKRTPWRVEDQRTEPTTTNSLRSAGRTTFATDRSGWNQPDLAISLTNPYGRSPTQSTL